MKTSPPGNGGESTFSRSLGKWDVDPTPWLEVSSYRPFKNLIMIRFPKWNLDHSHSRVKTCLNQVLAHMNDLTLLQETLKGTLQMKDVRHGPPKFFWSFFWSRVYVCMKVRANYNSFQMLTHRVPPLNHNTPTLWEMELTVWCNNPSYISFCQMGGVEGVSQVWKKKIVWTLVNCSLWTCRALLLLKYHISRGQLVCLSVYRYKISYLYDFYLIYFGDFCLNMDSIGGHRTGSEMEVRGGRVRKGPQART